MIEIKTIRYIDTDDVEELTGKHWNDFEFAQMAANDAYQTLYCDDESLKELYEEYEDEIHREGELTVADFEDEYDFNWYRRTCYATRLKNQIELVEILRKDYGIYNSILIWISW